MENNLKKAYAEVEIILSLMEEKYIEKIPKKMIEFFKKEKMENYEPTIDSQIPLDEQNLQMETFEILAMLDLNYWCESEEEKQKLLSAFSENDRKKEEELREKYNPDNLFKNKDNINNTDINRDVSIVEYKKDNWIKKLLDRLKSMWTSIRR